MAGTARLPDDLDDGYRRFRRDRYPAQRERYVELARAGQHPTTLVIACSDSRSAPEVVFDARPGDLFVVRNIGALVPALRPATSATREGSAGGDAVAAALEYAVLGLGVRSILVLGHGRCGAIAAALQDGEARSSGDALGAWVESLRGLATRPEIAGLASLDERREALERRSVEQSIANLGTYPWIRGRETQGRLALIGAWFDVGRAELHELWVDGWARVAES